MKNMIAASAIPPHIIGVDQSLMVEVHVLEASLISSFVIFAIAGSATIQIMSAKTALTAITFFKVALLRNALLGLSFFILFFQKK